MATKILKYFSLLLIAGVSSRNMRIIGGQISNIRECPYLVSIKFQILNKHICAGTIITHKHILTAAHCLYQKEKFYPNLRIHIGSSTLSGNSGTVLSIYRVNLHPGFIGDIVQSIENHNDIAVITVNETIEFNEFQNKAELPTHDIIYNSFVTMSGWGYTDGKTEQFSDQVMKATVKIVKLPKISNFLSFRILRDDMCTYMDECRTHTGDSGGPLVADGVIIGIISFSVPVIPPVPDVQTNVYKHLNFIRSIIGQST